MRIANNVETLAFVPPGGDDATAATGLKHLSIIRTLENGLSMQSSFIRKVLFGLIKGITSPRSTLSWIVRGHLAKDQVFVSQTYWFTGSLPRVPLAKILPGVENVAVAVPRAFDRNTAPKTGASITAGEACPLGAITRWLDTARALEIGTYDGNTALLLAANVAGGGGVVTVDLPPGFTADRQDSLTFSHGEFNLTERHQLGRQTKGHPLAGRIRQVYGDSAELDWATLGGPFDLVFIDGCHSEAYVRSDTSNALKHLKPGGAIVWHDYGMIPEVSGVVDRFARDVTTMRVCAIEGTRLAIAVSGTPPAGAGQ
jgi:predicted O-methyltransferase YrrM